MPPRRTFRRIALTLSASAIVVLLLLELGLRAFFPASAFHDTRRDCFWGLLLEERRPIYEERGLGRVRLDPELGWRMAPTVGPAGERVPMSKLHDPASVATTNAPGAHRLVVLGDSFTRGLGVPDDQTYAARMDAAVDALEVVNLGAHGYGTDQELLLWRRVGAGCAPDVVLLAFYVPNFHRNLLHVREFPKPWFLLADGELELHGTPVPTLADAIERYARPCHSGPRLFDLLAYGHRCLWPAEDEDRFERKAELIRAILRDLQASVAAAGARLFVVVIPHRRLERYPDHARIVDVLEECGRALGVPTLDLTPTLRGWRDRRGAEPLYGANEHWTPRGHEVASEHLLAFLRDQGAL